MYIRKLRTSLALNFVLAALAPIVFLSLIVLLHLSHDIKNEIEDRNLLLAKTVSAQVGIFLREPLSTLDNISAMLRANPSWSDEDIQQLLDLHIRDSKLFESIFMLDQDGIIENVGLPISREEFHEDHKGVNLAHLPVYKKANATSRPTWSNTFLSVMSGNISIALCIPEKEFSLIGNLNIKILSDFVQGLNEEQRTQVALIDRSGTIIVHPDPLLGQTQVNINNLPIIRQGFEGNEETTRFTFNNINYIGSTKKIANPDWLVLVSQNANEAYHGISTTAYSFIIVALGASMLAILFALMKTRKIISPITEVANHAQQIADGDYRVQFTRSRYVEIRELTASIQHMADAVKSRETELQMSQKRFREIYNTTGEAIFIRNAQTFNLVDANEAMTELFGYSLDELKEKSISELSSGDPNFSLQKAKEKISKALHEGPQVFEWNYVRKNSEPFWAEVALKKAEIDGKTRILGVIRNITERKTLERQLAQSQKMEAIGTLAGGIAHDFNNILTPIMGYVEMSMLHRNDPDKVQNDMNNVLRAVHRAKELVQQILTFSRQEGQQASPTNVAIIIKEALKLLRSSIPSTIDIKQYIDPECGTVMANPTQIHQVLMNLCTNAYHAMREDGGTMSVSLVPTTISSPDNPALKNLPEGTYLRLEVSDTGHGMDKSTLNRIMEPYFTTKKEEEGTGLGLSVVHGIVKGIGGEITVYSEVEKGSTFRVFLPVIEHSMISDPVDRSTPPPRGHECLILVDDEEMILEMQQEMLSRLGYTVKTFLRPEKALDFISDQSNTCDLLITDMTMPRMTGMALAGKIRETNPELPIIVCTGFSETISKKEALAQGINDFLTKPVELHQLALSVRETLDQRKTPQE